MDKEGGGYGEWGSQPLMNWGLLKSFYPRPARPGGWIAPSPFPTTASLRLLEVHDMFVQPLQMGVFRGTSSMAPAFILMSLRGHPTRATNEK